MKRCAHDIDTSESKLWWMGRMSPIITGYYNLQCELIGTIRSRFSWIFLPLPLMRGNVNYECTELAGPRGKVFDSELTRTGRHLGLRRGMRFQVMPFWEVELLFGTRHDAGWHLVVVP